MEALVQILLGLLVVLEVVVQLILRVAQEIHPPLPLFRVMLAVILAMLTPLVAVGAQVRLEIQLVELAMVAMAAMV